jgi:hypothetical protein
MKQTAQLERALCLLIAHDLQPGLARIGWIDVGSTASRLEPTYELLPRRGSRRSDQAPRLDPHRHRHLQRGAGAGSQPQAGGVAGLGKPAASDAGQT